MRRASAEGWGCFQRVRGESLASTWSVVEGAAAKRALAVFSSVDVRCAALASEQCPRKEGGKWQCRALSSKCNRSGVCQTIPVQITEKNKEREPWGNGE